jgi:hypothetical protein
MGKSLAQLQEDLENARGGMNTGDIEDAMAAIAQYEIEALRELVKQQKQLLEAVKVSEFSGLSCDSVGGKNWFDLRDEVLRET